MEISRSRKDNITTTERCMASRVTKDSLICPSSSVNERFKRHMTNLLNQSRPSEAREALVAYQEIQERRLTPPPWLDQLRSKFRNIVRAGAAPMCTKKKISKIFAQKVWLCNLPSALCFQRASAARRDERPRVLMFF